MKKFDINPKLSTFNSHGRFLHAFPKSIGSSFHSYIFFPPDFFSDKFSSRSTSVSNDWLNNNISVTLSDRTGRKRKKKKENSKPDSYFFVSSLHSNGLKILLSPSLLSRYPILYFFLSPPSSWFLSGIFSFFGSHALCWLNSPQSREKEGR